jgi:hypothetical protein
MKQRYFSRRSDRAARALPLGLVAAVALVGVSLSDVGRAAVPAKCFVAQNGTVYDGRTKLTWQQTVDPNGYYDWSGAAVYCSGLSLNGGGWRVPSLKELLTLLDVSHADPIIDPVAFPNTPLFSFWTSTVTSPDLNSPGTAWELSFSAAGMTNVADVSFTALVRCVR